MAADVKVDVSEWLELAKNVDEIKERLGNLEPVLKGRAAALGGVIASGFENSQSPMGERWEGLAPATVEKRRKNHKTMRPLVDTGQLKGSVNTRASNTSVLFGVSGNATAYAGAHQFGTSRAGRGRKTKIPARPFLPLGSSGVPEFGAESSKAGTWLKRTLDRVRDYVLRGVL